MHDTTRILLLVGGLFGGLTHGASRADATPSTGHAKERAFVIEHVLKKLENAPPDEAIAPSSWLGIYDEEKVDGACPRETITVADRTFFVELTGEGNERRVEVRDGHKLLYDIDDGAPQFAFGFSGKRVLFAGNYRKGAFAYDLPTGKKLASVQDLVFSPKGHFAISTPPFETSGCANRSRVFRIPLDKNEKPYAIDTSPMRRQVLCTEDGALPKGNFTEHAAVSPKGDYYAVLSRDELAIFDAKNDKKVASLEEPPFDVHEGAHNAVTFSKSGKYVIVSHARRLDAEPERVWLAFTTTRRKK